MASELVQELVPKPNTKAPVWEYFGLEKDEARLAKKYLCACATSSPSECLFSTSGNIVTLNRCNMKLDKVARHVNFPYKKSLTF